MYSYLITYDLAGKGKNYESLIKEIKNFTYHKILDSTWIIKSDKTSKEIKELLKDKLDSDDKLAVFKLTGTASWYNLGSDSNKWIKDNL